MKTYLKIAIVSSMMAQTVASFDPQKKVAPPLTSSYEIWRGDCEKTFQSPLYQTIIDLNPTYIDKNDKNDLENDRLCVKTFIRLPMILKEKIIEKNTNIEKLMALFFAMIPTLNFIKENYASMSKTSKNEQLLETIKNTFNYLEVKLKNWTSLQRKIKYLIAYKKYYTSFFKSNSPYIPLGTWKPWGYEVDSFKRLRAKRLIMNTRQTLTEVFPRFERSLEHLFAHSEQYSYYCYLFQDKDELWEFLKLNTYIYYTQKKIKRVLSEIILQHLKSVNNVVKNPISYIKKEHMQKEKLFLNESDINETFEAFNVFFRVKVDLNFIIQKCIEDIELKDAFTFILKNDWKHACESLLGIKNIDTLALEWRKDKNFTEGKELKALPEGVKVLLSGIKIDCKKVVEELLTLRGINEKNKIDEDKKFEEDLKLFGRNEKILIKEAKNLIQERFYDPAAIQEKDLLLISEEIINQEINLEEEFLKSGITQEILVKALKKINEKKKVKHLTAVKKIDTPHLIFLDSVENSKAQPGQKENYIPKTNFNWKRALEVILKSQNKFSNDANYDYDGSSTEEDLLEEVVGKTHGNTKRNREQKNSVAKNTKNKKTKK